MKYYVIWNSDMKGPYETKEYAEMAADVFATCVPDVEEFKVVDEDELKKITGLSQL